MSALGFLIGWTLGLAVDNALNETAARGHHIGSVTQWGIIVCLAILGDLIGDAANPKTVRR